MRRAGLFALVLFAVLAPAGAGGQPASVPRELRVVADATLQQSGLLERLLRPFEGTHGVRVSPRFLPAKDALELGAAGRADVVWVSAPRTEQQYLNQGFYLDRRLVMYTDYVLVGPLRDPARVKGMRRVVLAFRRIAQSKAPFVSGGERSGSYILEEEHWKKAGVSPAAPWYILSDAGQEQALVVAAAKGAYLLMDRSSAGRLLPKDQLQVIEGVRSLRGAYHVMEVNPHRFPNVNYRDAKAFGDFLLSPVAQEIIRSLSVD